MADDELEGADETVVELPHVRHMAPIHSGNAREMALRKAEKDREKRAERQLQRQKRAQAVLGDAVDEAAQAAENRSLDLKTNEELGDMLTKRMLKVMILGGEAFLPTGPREAMEIAASASAIAYREVQKRKMLARPDDESEIEGDAMTVARAMRTLKRATKREQTG